jgi:hypothetical protein
MSEPDPDKKLTWIETLVAVQKELSKVADPKTNRPARLAIPVEDNEHDKWRWIIEVLAERGWGVELADDGVFEFFAPGPGARPHLN